jgi:hypothetical protein
MSLLLGHRSVLLHIKRTGHNPPRELSVVWWKTMYFMKVEEAKGVCKDCSNKCWLNILYARLVSVQSRAHLLFRHCTSLISRALALISNCKCLAWRAVLRWTCIKDYQSFHVWTKIGSIKIKYSQFLFFLLVRAVSANQRRCAYFTQE